MAKKNHSKQNEQPEQQNTESTELTREDVTSIVAETLKRTLPEVLKANNEQMLGVIQEQLAPLMPKPEESDDDQPSAADLALEKLFEANMAGLDEDDMALIEDLSDGTMVGKVQAFSKLKKRGYFKKTAQETTQDTQTGDDDENKDKKEAKTGKKGEEGDDDGKKSKKGSEGTRDVRHTSERVSLNGNTTDQPPKDMSLSEALRLAGQRMDAGRR